MRRDVWILFFLYASVFAVPTTDDHRYFIEIFRNGSTKVYHDKCVEIKYNLKETVKITFIQSGYEEHPFMEFFWIKDGQKVKRGEIVHNFRAQINITLNSDDNDCRLQCEIWFRNETTRTLEVHFLQNIGPKEKNIQNVGNLFKIILICLGAFIAISILIMILIAIYKYFKNKSSSGYDNTTYPDYSEIIPMNKINNEPKNFDDSLDRILPGTERGVVNNIPKETAVE